MPIISSRVTVTSTATQIVDPTRGGVVDPTTCLIRNAGGFTVYLGGVGVTTATGFELPPGGSFNADLIAGDVLYGIVVGSSSSELHVMRFRQ